jgi:AcrR family transcriptional regulator
MNEKFFDLKTEKQDRMINASLKIFALKGYQHASTDDIVKEAGISKGLLFHYFGSKLGLYTFLAAYGVRYMKLEMSNIANDKETDYFVILKKVETTRLAVMKKFPYLQQFLNVLEQECEPEAIKATKEERSNLLTLYHDISKRTDYSRFRNEADATLIGKMIDMTLKSLMKDSMKSSTYKPEQYHAEAIKYIEMIGKLVNK